jgi:hypothetical protein
VFTQTIRVGGQAIAGICAGFMLAGCGGSRSTSLNRSFSSSTEEIAVNYPSGWRLATHNDNYVPDPALCFDLQPNADGKVDLRVVEYLPPYFNPRYLSTYQPRPKQFQLTAFRKGDEDWSPGKILSFRAQGRVFFVGVVLPATARQPLRHTLERILDSVRIAAHGRCRPTSGVGSHGVPDPTRKHQK